MIPYLDCCGDKTKYPRTSLHFILLRHTVETTFYLPFTGYETSCCTAVSHERGQSHVWQLSVHIFTSRLSYGMHNSPKHGFNLISVHVPCTHDWVQLRFHMLLRIRHPSNFLPFKWEFMFHVNEQGVDCSPSEDWPFPRERLVSVYPL